MRSHQDFDRVLDDCVNRLNRGEPVNVCLADYPEHARDLEPLLRAMWQAKHGYWFEPSPATRTAARQEFESALLNERSRHTQPKPSPLARLFSRPLAWATAASVLLVALMVYGLVGPGLPTRSGLPQPGIDEPPNAAEPASPEQEPPDATPGATVTARPSADGSFVFLISDEVNAIGDFKSLVIDVAGIGLKMEDGANAAGAPWVRLQPETAQVDLTQLQGDRAQQVWRGDIPQGHYSKVFIEVSEVTGSLKDTGRTADIELPSDRLHLLSPFEVTSNSTVHFVYDLTVVAAGQPSGKDKYILRPQAEESGAGHPFRRVESPSGKGKPAEAPGAGSSADNAGPPDRVPSEPDTGGSGHTRPDKGSGEKGQPKPDNPGPSHVVNGETGPPAGRGLDYRRADT